MDVPDGVDIPVGEAIQCETNEIWYLVYTRTNLLFPAYCVRF